MDNGNGVGQGYFTANEEVAGSIPVPFRGSSDG